MSLVGPYHTDHRQPVSASCDDGGACLAVPCAQPVNSTVVGTAAMAEGSPSVAARVVAACVHIVDAVNHPIGRCRSYACIELAVVGVAAAAGDVLGAASPAPYAAWGVAGTWEIGG